MTIPELFMYLNLLKKTKSIYRVTIASVIVSATILAAGVIHMVNY